jgi:four helix bundle protein
MTTHKDLEVWKLSVEFTTDIYRATKDFPKEELYGLVSQLRRASVSIASNVAEGAARQSTKEFIQFIYHALGSASEVETQLIVSNNLGYLDDSSYKLLIFKQTQLSKMLSGLIKSLKNKE